MSSESSSEKVFEALAADIWPASVHGEHETAPRPRARDGRLAGEPREEHDHDSESASSASTTTPRAIGRPLVRAVRGLKHREAGRVGVDADVELVLVREQRSAASVKPAAPATAHHRTRGRLEEHRRPDEEQRRDVDQVALDDEGREDEEMYAALTAVYQP